MRAVVGCPRRSFGNGKRTGESLGAKGFFLLLGLLEAVGLADAHPIKGSVVVMGVGGDVGVSIDRVELCLKTLGIFPVFKRPDLNGKATAVVVDGGIGTACGPFFLGRPRATRFTRAVPGPITPSCLAAP